MNHSGICSVVGHSGIRVCSVVNHSGICSVFDHNGLCSAIDHSGIGSVVDHSGLCGDLLAVTFVVAAALPETSIRLNCAAEPYS